MLVAAAEQGQEEWYRNHQSELHALLPVETMSDLSRRGFIVAPRDIGLLVARLKAARLKQEDLQLEIDE